MGLGSDFTVTCRKDTGFPVAWRPFSLKTEFLLDPSSKYDAAVRKNHFSSGNRGISERGKKTEVSYLVFAALTGTL